MPINASYEYFNAEKGYLKAEGMEDRIYWLEEMIRTAPKHKGSENLLKELKVRLKKFREKEEKGRKSGRRRKGIRKEGYQFVLVGLTNSGKSLLLSRLTHAVSFVGDYDFTTRKPEIGTFEFDGVRAQVVDLPSIGSENFDRSIANTADCLLIVVSDLSEVGGVEEKLKLARGKRLVVVNKIDLLSGDELRKLRARLKSKKIHGVVVSAKNGEGLDELKGAMFSEMGVIRIYTKEPGKEKSREPIVLKKGASVKDAAEEILKGFSSRVRDTRLTGPSGKFKNQRVGLGHVLKDLDVVEFHTR